MVIMIVMPVSVEQRVIIAARQGGGRSTVYSGRDVVGAGGSILPRLEPNTATFTAVANRSN